MVEIIFNLKSQNTDNQCINFKAKTQLSLQRTFFVVFYHSKTKLYGLSVKSLSVFLTSFLIICAEQQQI
ncbi:MAG TPA: hypothetical protein DDZ41_00655 [Flavobacterium sp.]|nr:hypothetical protein [Flavobacterium sp.]